MWDNKTFEKALLFAFLAHKDQEMREPVGEPYSAHLTGVLAGAIKYSINDKVDWNYIVQLALLHDTIEDTKVTYEDIKKEFGEKVADGVLALSKNDALPKSEQMSDSVERIKMQPREVAIVKLADRLFNLGTKVVAWTKKKQITYKMEAQMMCDELGYASESLREALQTAIDNY